MSAAAIATAVAAPAADVAPAGMSPSAKIALASARSRHNAPSTDTQYISAFITVSDGFDREVLQKMGVGIGASAGNIISARIPSGSLLDVSELPGVIYIDVAGKVTPMIDMAREEAGVPYEVTVTGGEKLPLTGKGVILGVIDRGFDYTHETFRDADGNCRITRVWEQAGKSDRYPVPTGFDYGVELTSPADIEQAGGDVTGNSHGTHVAGIATGSSAFRDGVYSGVAPGAEIVLVSMDATDGDSSHLADAMAYIFNYAESVGKPCVINMSLGSQIGPHDGTSSFDRMADALSGEGRLLVGSAGNHGADSFHVSKSFAGAEDAPLATFIDFKSSPGVNNTGGTLDIWGDPDFNYGVELICYSSGKKIIDETLAVDMGKTDATEYTFSKNVEGSLTVAVEKNPMNGKLHVMIKSGITSVRNRYYVGIRVIPEGDGKVDVWADNNLLGLTDNDIEGYTAPDGTFETIAEIGGTAESVLTVGAYTTRDTYTVAGSTDLKETGQKMGDICTFSSYGPTADGRQKPEITAPGCFTISAVSSHDNSGTQILADVNEEGLHRYGYMQGTSMAAPFVAGVVAGWLEIAPTLNPELLKTVATQSARSDSFTQSGAVSRWGAGKINPSGGAMSLLANGIADVSDDKNGAIIWNDEIIFTHGGKAEVIMTDIEGRVVSAFAKDMTPGEAISLRECAGTVAKGLYIVTVSTPAGTNTAKILMGNHSN